MYDESDKALFGYLFLHHVRGDELADIHGYILNYVKTKLPREKRKVILPWISNLELLRYATAVIASRAYRSGIPEYQNLVGKKIEEMPMGNRTKELIDYIDPDNFGECLLPLVDLCNHKIPLHKQLKDKVEFSLLFQEGIANVGFASPYKKGVEVDYSYIPLSPNDKLLQSYGFYVMDNPNSQAHMMVPVNKLMFIKEKNEICKKLACFEQSLDGFYMSTMETANFQVLLKKNELPEGAIRALKLYVIQNFQNIPKKIKDKWVEMIMKKKPISYENEIMAYSYLRNVVDYNFMNYRLKVPDMIYSLHNTRKYYKENREEIVKNHKLRYQYRVRRKIMEVGKESHMIMIHTAKMAQDYMKTLVSDQFRKIKNYYTKEMTNADI
jgi:hypothetical protein